MSILFLTYLGVFPVSYMPRCLNSASTSSSQKPCKIDDVKPVGGSGRRWIDAAVVVDGGGRAVEAQTMLL